MNDNEKIKAIISGLAEEHKKIDDKIENWEESNRIEYEAEMLIADYCEIHGYLIEGFPTLKKMEIRSDDFDDYFCRERFQLYLDMLAVSHEDVAELMWYYTSLFWEDTYNSKQDYLESINLQLASEGFYDVRF